MSPQLTAHGPRSLNRLLIHLLYAQMPPPQEGLPDHSQLRSPAGVPRNTYHLPTVYLIFLFMRFIVYLPAAPRGQELLSVLLAARFPAPGTVPSP